MRRLLPLLLIVLFPTSLVAKTDYKRWLEREVVWIISKAEREAFRSLDDDDTDSKSEDHSQASISNEAVGAAFSRSRCLYLFFKILVFFNVFYTFLYVFVLLCDFDTCVSSLHTHIAF